MKIIYLHQYFKFPDEAGGTRSFDLATGFINSGYNVQMLTSTSDKKYKINKRWSRIDKNGLVIYYIYLPYSNKMSYLRRSTVFLKFIWFSTFKLLSLNGDLVLATSSPLTIGIPALFKKWFHGVPFIFETRDIWPEAVIAIGAINNKIIQKILFFLESIIYKNAKGIVPLSIDMKKSIISRYPELVVKQIKVIENISNIDRFQKGFNIKKIQIQKMIGFKPRFTILYAGAFGRVNGLNYVIELASSLINIDPSIVFILVGSGAEKKNIFDKAKKKGLLNKNIFILDTVSKNTLPQLYYECDMGSSFVLPIKELWSNSANKFFDTLAAGKPILINYDGWQKEIVKREDIGYVLPSIITDVEIERFMLYTHQKNTILKQQKKALNIAKNYFSTQIMIKKYINIFKKIKDHNA